MSGLPAYEVYAVKYGERDARRTEHFVGGDRHDAPMPMDYFVWAIVGDGRTIVVDTGFERADGEGRGRRYVRSVTDGLAAVGIDAATVDDVVITHLHYDHIGGFGEFPAARFHLQDREMAFATGRHMARKAIRHSFTATQIAGLVLEVFADRVVFHDGDDDLAPGISLHLIGGHTPGLQVVRVHTEVGWLVLASDAAHYYEHLDSGRPFVAVIDIPAMLEGHDTCRRLADDERFVVPGHDPLVLARYPAARDGLDGIAVRVDRVPAMAHATATGGAVMDTAALLVEGYGRIGQLVHLATDDLVPAGFAYQPEPGANSIAWLVWHLTRIQDDHVAEIAGEPQAWIAAGWADRLGMAPDPKLTGYGHAPDDVAALGRCAGVDLLAYFDDVDSRTSDYLPRAVGAELDRIIDTSWDPPVTVGVRLVSVLSDNLQHAGQARYLRGVYDRVA